MINYVFYFFLISRRLIIGPYPIVLLTTTESGFLSCRNYPLGNTRRDNLLHSPRGRFDLPALLFGHVTLSLGFCCSCPSENSTHHILSSTELAAVGKSRSRYLKHVCQQDCSPCLVSIPSFLLPKRHRVVGFEAQNICLIFF